MICGLRASVLIAAPIEGHTRPASQDDYQRIVRAGATGLSPDVSQVVFTHTRILEEENRTHSEARMVDRRLYSSKGWWEQRPMEKPFS